MDASMQARVANILGETKIPLNDLSVKEQAEILMYFLSKSVVEELRGFIPIADLLKKGRRANPSVVTFEDPIKPTTHCLEALLLYRWDEHTALPLRERRDDMILLSRSGGPILWTGVCIINDGIACYTELHLKRLTVASLSGVLRRHKGAFERINYYLWKAINGTLRSIGQQQQKVADFGGELRSVSSRIGLYLNLET